ncbi:hypothetical protein BT69DRAFT_1288504 [Atractiella rhizophila]|nr:hypothetical protein BT69DRAFT_1288504 [Atractiella rhizophila]
MKSSSWLQPRRQHVVEAEKKAQAEMLEYIRTPMEDNVQVEAVVDDTQVPVRSSIRGSHCFRTCIGAGSYHDSHTLKPSMIRDSACGLLLLFVYSWPNIAQIMRNEHSVKEALISRHLCILILIPPDNALRLCLHLGQ